MLRLSLLALIIASIASPQQVTQMAGSDTLQSSRPIINNNFLILQNSTQLQTDVGSADDYVVYLTPAPTSYPVNINDGGSGVPFFAFTVRSTNLTTTPTMNVNGLGPKLMQYPSGAPIQVGDLAQRGVYGVRYAPSCDCFQVQGVSSGGGGGGGGVSSVTMQGTPGTIVVTGGCSITTTGICVFNIANPFTFPGKATFSPSGTGSASFNIPAGGIPTTPVIGDIWNQAGSVKFYDGSTAQSFAFLTSTVASATTLASTPIQCGINNFASGITAAGNANCSPVSYGGLTGVPTLRYQNLAVAAVGQTPRFTLNLIAGSGVTITPVDNSVTNSTDVTITSSGGGGGSTPGGSVGQTQYNVNGLVLGGYTMGGDGVINTTTGVLTVTQTSGVPFAPSATVDTTNASNISGGTLPPARLPNPSAAALGGVRSYAQVANQWINSISTTGLPSSSQPACANISDAAASCSVDATNAGNISSGILSAVRGGTGLGNVAQFGVMIGQGAAPVSTVTGASGTLLQGAGGANPTFTANPVIGVSGTTLGTLGLSVNTGGVVTIRPSAPSGTYNFNLPSAAGATGQPLLSGGGGAAPMTFGTLSVGGGGTGMTLGVSGGMPYFVTTGSMASSGLLGASKILVGGGPGAAPTSTGVNIDVSNNVSTIGSVSTGVGAALTGTVQFTGNGNSNVVTLSIPDSPTVHTVKLPGTICTVGQTWTDDGSGNMGCSSAGSGTVSNIITTAPLAGGPISTTGTISITGLAGGVLAGSGPAFTITPVLGVAGASLGKLGFAGNTSGTVTVQSGAAAGTWTLTLPTTAGAVNQFLQTDGSGVTSWADGSGGGGGGGQIDYQVSLPQPNALEVGFSVVSPATVANTASATTLLGQHYGASIIRAGAVLPGRTVIIRASGLLGTAVTVPNLTITILVGGVTIASISPTLIGSLSNDGWDLEYRFTVQSLTSVTGAGCMRLIGTAGSSLMGCAAGTTTGLNFASSQAVDVKATWNTGAAANTITANVLTAQLF